MAIRKKALPTVPKMRGVEDLLTVNDDNDSKQKEVAIEFIKVNSKQPRRWFDPDKIAQLMESVREYGILEPLLVRPLDDGGYEDVFVIVDVVFSPLQTLPLTRGWKRKTLA